MTLYTVREPEGYVDWSQYPQLLSQFDDAGNVIYSPYSSALSTGFAYPVQRFDVEHESRDPTPSGYYIRVDFGDSGDEYLPDNPNLLHNSIDIPPLNSGLDGTTADPVYAAAPGVVIAHDSFTDSQNDPLDDVMVIQHPPYPEAVKINSFLYAPVVRCNPNSGVLETYNLGIYSQPHVPVNNDSDPTCSSIAGMVCSYNPGVMDVSDDGAMTYRGQPAEVCVLTEDNAMFPSGTIIVHHATGVCVLRPGTVWDFATNSYTTGYTVSEQFLDDSGQIQSRTVIPAGTCPESRYGHVENRLDIGRVAGYGTEVCNMRYWQTPEGNNTHLDFGMSLTGAFTADPGVWYENRNYDRPGMVGNLVDPVNILTPRVGSTADLAPTQAVSAAAPKKEITPMIYTRGMEDENAFGTLSPETAFDENFVEDQQVAGR